MELNREHFRAMMFYDFRCEITQQQCADNLALAFGNIAPSRATVFRWFSEFKRGRSSFQDKFRQGRPKSVVVPENIDAVRELIMQDHHATYREIEANLGISSTRIYSILHEHLDVKKIRSDCVKIRTNNNNAIHKKVTNNIPNDNAIETTSHVGIIPKFEIFEVEEELMYSQQIQSEINTQMQSSFINMSSTNQDNKTKLGAFDDDEENKIQAHTATSTKTVLSQQSAPQVTRPTIVQPKKVLDVPTTDKFDLLPQKLENESKLHDVLNKISLMIQRQSVATERQAAAAEALLQYLKTENVN